MARPLGSVNKSGLNLTTLFRNYWTEDDLQYIYEKMLSHIKSDDPDVSFRAYSLFLNRFTVAQDKLADVIAKEDMVETKEEYERLLRTLISDKETTEVQTDE